MSPSVSDPRPSLGLLGTARSRLRALIDSPSVRQFGHLSGGRAVGAAISFVWFAVAARQLPVSVFGDLALILAIGAVMTVIADAGFVLVLNEVVAADPARGRASFLLTLRRRLTLVPLAAIGTVVFYLLASSDRSIWVPLIYTVSLTASVFYTTATAAIRGAGSVAPDALNEVLSRLGLLVLASAIVFRGGGLVAVVAAYAAVDVCSAIVLTPLAWRRLEHGLPFDQARFAARRLVPIGFAALAGLVYYRVDVWLLALLTSSNEVARYSVCYRLMDGVMIPAGVLAVITVRSTAHLDPAGARRKIDRMAAMLCLCMVPIVLVFEGVPAQLLGLAFGHQYADAAPILRILALAIVPTVAGLAWSPLAGLRGHGLVGITVSSLVGNVVLNLLLIPHIGAEGAAIATVVGQVIFAVYVRFRLRLLPSTMDPFLADAPELDIYPEES